VCISVQGVCIFSQGCAYNLAEMIEGKSDELRGFAKAGGYVSEDGAGGIRHR
jgi:hypothetical protein